MFDVNVFMAELKELKVKREFPRDINFLFDNNGKTLKVELNGFLDKKNCRRLEPYALACLIEARKKKANISKVIFILTKRNINDSNYMLNYEALKRRISFLSVNNKDIQFELFLDNKKISLYDYKSLFGRPANEVIHTKISKRSDDNKSNLLEKAFQAFLYGKGLNERTNDRLAILGEDFYQIKGKDIGILREFPTGVFDAIIAKSTQIMPTELVDIVTLNKSRNLSVIELKLDNPELEVISQILDYSLYFVCYLKQILEMPSVVNVFDVNKIKKKIFCYVVNNHFHPKFDNILPFYSTKNKDYGFYLRKIVLGETKEI